MLIDAFKISFNARIIQITTFHLAQVNVAQAKADMDSDLMQGFVSRLDEINALCGGIYLASQGR